MGSLKFRVRLSKQQQYLVIVVALIIFFFQIQLSCFAIELRYGLKPGVKYHYFSKGLTFVDGVISDWVLPPTIQSFSQKRGKTGAKLIAVEFYDHFPGTGDWRFTPPKASASYEFEPIFFRKGESNTAFIAMPIQNVEEGDSWKGKVILAIGQANRSLDAEFRIAHIQRSGLELVTIVSSKSQQISTDEILKWEFLMVFSRKIGLPVSAMFSNEIVKRKADKDKAWRTLLYHFQLQMIGVSPEFPSFTESSEGIVAY